MEDILNDWIILVYRIPAQPTRLRLQVWRKLQQMGALYLQNAVSALPNRPDLAENMDYIAGMIEEMGGSCYLFSAKALLPGSPARLAEEFRAQSDKRMEEIAARLDEIQGCLNSAAEPDAVERIEDDVKRERVSFLRARRLAFFGGTKEEDVDVRMDHLKKALDDLYRSGR